MGGLFGSSNQTSTSQTQLPPELTSFYQQRIPQLNEQYQLAKQAGGQDYTPYGDYRVQPFTQDQWAARDMTLNNVGLGRNQLANADALSQFGSRGFLENGPAYQNNAVTTGNYVDNVQKYMNPYQKSVLNDAALEMEKQATRQQNADWSRSTKMGAFGGDRMAVMDSMRNRDLNQNIGEMYRRGLSDAYTQGAQIYASDAARDLTAQTQNQNQNLLSWNALRDQFNQDQARRLSAAQMQAGLGQQSQAMGAFDAAQVGQWGDKEQALGQKSLDNAYADYMTQRGWPYQQVGFMSQILNSQQMPQYGQSTTTNSPVQNNTGTALIGAGLTAAAIYF